MTYYDAYQAYLSDLANEQNVENGEEINSKTASKKKKGIPPYDFQMHP